MFMRCNVQDQADAAGDQVFRLAHAPKHALSFRLAAVRQALFITALPNQLYTLRIQVVVAPNRADARESCNGAGKIIIFEVEQCPWILIKKRTNCFDHLGSIRENRAQEKLFRKADFHTRLPCQTAHFGRLPGYLCEVDRAFWKDQRFVLIFFVHKVD